MRPMTKRQFLWVLQNAVKFNKVNTVKRMIKVIPLRHRNFKLTMYNVGGTLLHLAASQDFPAMVDSLLKCGLDPSIKNALGETALQVARDHGAAACLPILAATPREPLFRTASSAPAPSRTPPVLGGSTPTYVR